MRSSNISAMLLCILACHACMAAADREISEQCNMRSPWLREETAMSILRSGGRPESVSAEAVRESSVHAQLLLWGFLAEPEKYEERVREVSIDTLLASHDDYVSGLLWLAANSLVHRDRLPGIDQHFEALDTWADAFVKKEPRKMFIYLAVLSRISGTQTLSRAELEAVDSRIEDPSISFHIAGKLMQEGMHEEAHARLIEAFEGGLISGLLGLGELEVSYFENCSRRGRLYLDLAVKFFDIR